MKNIYHEHTSSDSFGSSHWTDKDWYLCETEEEYNEQVAKFKKKAADYQTSNNAKYYGAWRIVCSDEQKLHAQECYYAHEWQGKTFDCVGVCFTEHLERSDRYTYVIKPNTISEIKECKDHGCGWMYGS